MENINLEQKMSLFEKRLEEIENKLSNGEANNRGV